MNRIFQVLILTGAMLLIMACAGSQSHTQSDLVGEYAECLANPAMPLHELAGSPTVADAKATIIQELADGENTLEDIKAALTLYCK